MTQRRGIYTTLLHPLWSICKIVIDTGSRWMLRPPLVSLEFLTKQIRLCCNKCTGEIEEHNPHSASCFVLMKMGLLKQVYNGMFNSQLHSNMQTAQGLDMWLFAYSGSQEFLHELWHCRWWVMGGSFLVPEQGTKFSTFSWIKPRLKRCYSTVPVQSLKMLLYQTSRYRKVGGKGNSSISWFGWRQTYRSRWVHGGR